jgi:hypothetical protein
LIDRKSELNTKSPQIPKWAYKKAKAGIEAGLRLAPREYWFGVLVVVCWNMADFLRLLHEWRGASVLMATFSLTLIEDLTFGIIAGCVLAAQNYQRRRTWC